MRWLDGITNSVMGVRLFVTPTDCSLLGSSVHGILQARILKCVAMPSSRGSSRPRDQPTSLKSPALADGFFASNTTWEAQRFLKYITLVITHYFFKV